MKIYILPLFVLCFWYFSQAQQDTIYFDQSWDVIEDKAEAHYYRTIEPVGDLFEIRDYYLSGVLQMDGYSSSKEKDIWEGLVTWYHEDGSKHYARTYKNHEFIGPSFSYDGDKEYKLVMQDGEAVSGQIIRVYDNFKEFFDLDQKQSITFYEDMKGIRSVDYYSEISDDRIERSEYFDENGEKIGELTYQNGRERDGIKVEYFNDDSIPFSVRSKSIYNLGNSYLLEQYHSNGQLKEQFIVDELKSVYFDPEGNKIGELTYEGRPLDLIPLNGTKYSTDEYSDVTNKTTYKEGLKTKEVIKDKGVTTILNYENKQLIDRTTNDPIRDRSYYAVYKDNLIHEGTTYEHTYEIVERTYQEGLLMDEKNYYSDHTLFSHYKNNQITYYDKQGKVLGELVVEEKNSNTSYHEPISGFQVYQNYYDEITEINEYLNGKIIESNQFYRTKNNTFKTVRQYNREDCTLKQKEINYYSDGKKRDEIFYSDNGYDEETAIYYNMDGEKMGEFNFENNHGTKYTFSHHYPERIEAKEYYENGILLRWKRYTEHDGDFVLIEDVDLNEKAIRYNEQGEVIAEATCKNGKPFNGLFYTYDDYRHNVTEYQEGKKHGKYTQYDYYFENITEEGEYKNDLRDGEFITYDRKGFILHQSKYKNDVQIEQAFYNQQGEQIGELTYRDGEPFDGLEIVNKDKNHKKWYENGQLVQEEFVGDNYRDNRVKYQYEKNRINVTEYFADTQTKKYTYTLLNHSDSYSRELIGDVIRYNEQGQEIHRANVIKGKLISGTIWFRNNYDSDSYAYMEIQKNEQETQFKMFNDDQQVILQLQQQDNLIATDDFFEEFLRGIYIYSIEDNILY